MSTALRPAIFIACLTLVAILASTSSGQRTNRDQTRAATSPASSGDRIAVIDVNYVFKNHEGFKQLVEDWKQRVKTAEGKMKARNQAIEKNVEQLRIYKPGTEDFKRMEERVAKDRADLQVEVQINKKELMVEEAKMYLSVYQTVKEQVAYFAKQNGITLVLRYNSGEVNSEDPRQIQSLMLRPVIYQDHIDITNDILSRVNGGAPPVRTGQKPASTQNRAVPQKRRQ